MVSSICWPVVTGESPSWVLGGNNAFSMRWSGAPAYNGAVRNTCSEISLETGCSQIVGEDEHIGGLDFEQRRQKENKNEILRFVADKSTSNKRSFFEKPIFINDINLTFSGYFT